MNRAYKTKLHLNNKQAAYFRQCAGAARFVFNWALADRKSAYEERGETVNQYEQAHRFNSIKDELCPWIRDYPSKAIGEEFKHVDLAYKNFFRRVKNGEAPGFPRFKSKYDIKKFSLRGRIHVADGRAKLPIIGWVKLAERGYVPEDAKILKVTLSERGGDWYISFQVEMSDPEPMSLNGRTLGIDRGIKVLLAVSDGESDTIIPNPKALQAHEQKLLILQRKLSRQEKGSANWKETKAQINKVHQKIANVRAHHQHNASRYVTAVIRPSRIVLEDLNTKGMTAKAKPKQDEDGRYLKNHRAQKAGLNRSLLDAGMGELGRQIEYKAQWAGIEVVHADRWFASSKTCSGCGAVDGDLTLKDRTYTCEGCGLVIDRDVNAARNLAAL